MQKKIIVLIVIAVLLVGIAGYFLYQYRSDIEKQQQPVACTMEAKICPDGSSVDHTGPKCEFSPCPNSITYINEEFGFDLTFPVTWQGYTVEKQSWQGWAIDTGEQKYSGPEIIVKNPQTTSQQQYQDIPIMIFTHDQWGPESDIPGVYNPAGFSVSAAPIGPAKIGENTKYVFATPPRWYGFTDDVGFQEAVDIVKTFKAF